MFGGWMGTKLELKIGKQKFLRESGFGFLLT